ncbi:hypothetical protein KGA66_19570 [Actinocrinis puniceicyclus]|uniref:Uncharacterized protein n=1 Tax=Actinocrinis puniceicyclus TaxID=977794 RepID=A0A8J8BDH6_9ACTN|nr:SDR family NAD(P)-dependent oxidoreductase [Actinocrinis puniceicyclus]MBS2965258.1 hypothetical protein [Actinocrinis puniceicyclus]
MNVSSALGSFGRVTDPDSRQSAYSLPIYPSSKAAVNMLTVQYAKGLPDLRINAVEPGFTATDLHGMSGEGVQSVDRAPRRSCGWLRSARTGRRAGPPVPSTTATAPCPGDGGLALGNIRKNPD